MSNIVMKIPKVKLAMLNSPNPNGEKCIYIRVPFSDRYLKKSTNLWILPKDWDEKQQIVLPSNENYEVINNKLSLALAPIRSKILKLEPPIAICTIQEILGLKTTDMDSRDPIFVEYAHKVNDLHYKMEKYGYTAWYNKKRSIIAFEFFLANFTDTPSPHMSEMKLSMFDEYVNYRVNIKKNTSKEGINKTLVPLYLALDYGEKNGIVKKSVVAPILGNFLITRNTKYQSEPSEEEKTRYLTPEQMKYFYDYCKKVKSKNARIILDMFFFSYFACGLRLSDVITLEWKHIDFEKRLLSKVQVKTKRKAAVDIPLNSSAMEILERWKNYRLNDRFVFNRLPDDFDLNNQYKLFMTRNAQDKGVNRVLATVGRNAKLPITVTMHVARHSFAVKSINKGMSIYMLSKLLGHSSIAATEKTYAQFLQEKVSSDILVMNEEF